MMNKKYPIPKEVFDDIYVQVPRLTVELIVKTSQGIVLSKRSIEPEIGTWHIPGGTVYFGETLHDAVHRVAKNELGIAVNIERLLGYIEYPTLEANGYKGWPIGIAFEVEIMAGEVKGSEQGEEVRIFKKIPDNTFPDQAKFLKNYL